jgi:hypothetical protein
MYNAQYNLPKPQKPELYQSGAVQSALGTYQGYQDGGYIDGGYYPATTDRSFSTTLSAAETYPNLYTTSIQPQQPQLYQPNQVYTTQNYPTQNYTTPAQNYAVTPQNYNMYPYNYAYGYRPANNLMYNQAVYPNTQYLRPTYQQTPNQPVLGLQGF